MTRAVAPHRIDPLLAVSDAALVLGRVEGVLDGLGRASELDPSARAATRHALGEFRAQANPVIWAAVSVAMAHPEQFRVYLSKQLGEPLGEPLERPLEPQRKGHP